MYKQPNNKKNNIQNEKRLAVQPIPATLHLKQNDKPQMTIAKKVKRPTPQKQKHLKKAHTKIKPAQSENLQIRKNNAQTGVNIPSRQWIKSAITVDNSIWLDQIKLPPTTSIKSPRNQSVKDEKIVIDNQTAKVSINGKCFTTTTIRLINGEEITQWSAPSDCKQQQKLEQQLNKSLNKYLNGYPYQ